MASDNKMATPVPQPFVQFAKELKFALRDNFVKHSKSVERISKFQKTEQELVILKGIDPKLLPFINKDALRQSLIAEETILNAKLDPSALYKTFENKCINLYKQLDTLKLDTEEALFEAVNLFMKKTIREAKYKWAELAATGIIKNEKTAERLRLKQKEKEVIMDQMGTNPSKESLFTALSQMLDYKMQNLKLSHFSKSQQRSVSSPPKRTNKGKGKPNPKARNNKTQKYTNTVKAKEHNPNPNKKASSYAGFTKSQQQRKFPNPKHKDKGKWLGNRQRTGPDSIPNFIPSSRREFSNASNRNVSVKKRHSNEDGPKFSKFRRAPNNRPPHPSVYGGSA